MEHEESTTPLAVEINLSEPPEQPPAAPRREHPAELRARRALARPRPPPADAERAAAPAAPRHGGAGRGARRAGPGAGLLRGAERVLARVPGARRRAAARRRGPPRGGGARGRGGGAPAAVDDDDDLGEAVGRARRRIPDVGSGTRRPVPAFVDRTPTPLPPPAPAEPPLLPSPPETWTQKKRRKPTLPSHLRAKRRK